MNLEKIKQEAHKYYRLKFYEVNSSDKDFEAGAIFGVNATVESAMKEIDRRQNESDPMFAIVYESLKRGISDLKINP